MNDKIINLCFFINIYDIIVSNANSKLSLRLDIMQINNLGDMNEKNISGRR